MSKYYKGNHTQLIINGTVIGEKGKSVPVEQVSEINLGKNTIAGGKVTIGGVTYEFNRYEKGDAIYKQCAKQNQKKKEKKKNKKRENKAIRKVTLEEIPKGAILDKDYVGGNKSGYHLMKPLTMVEDKFVYLPNE